jgi:hypothetical protein
MSIFDNSNTDDLEIDFYLKDYREIGVVANKDQAKTSLVLYRLVRLKKKYPNLNICVLGAEPSLHTYLKSQGIYIILNKEDVMDLKIKNSVIYIDEFADLFNVSSQGKQLDRVKRFFNRIAHLNDWVIIATAQANFWNKFMCGLVKCFFVKEIDYDMLTNNTTIKRKVKGMPTNSDYRFECPINTYYAITDFLTHKHSFPYCPELDSKKDNINPFTKKTKKSERIGEKFSEKFGGKKGEISYVT